MIDTRWNGEPCTALRVTAIVADDGRFPLYWARHLVGTRRKAVQVEYGGQTFYLDDEDGSGWNKVTHGGSPHWAHNSLTVDPSSVQPLAQRTTPAVDAGDAVKVLGVVPMTQGVAELYRAPATDEDACLTHIAGACDGTTRDCAFITDAGRANVLRVLVDRAARGTLNDHEATTLRQRAEQVINGRATWKAKAEEIERDRDRLAVELEQAEAAIERARKVASRWAVLRTYGSAATELRAALDGTEQPTTED